ncbi:PR domain zinc finger protein 16 [Pteropus vampyrus]|uniref:PR domain zinc finger protein 16 n=1 Tax=Pteropus vampyrus TaxID=132908 RepID=A0A6P6CZ14_PTEVA|nr:PR domain zinc finger protein 16 [Pteropus vampyrus]
MRSKARARKLAKSDGDIVNNMYEPDPDLLAGESAEDETEDSIMSPIPMGPASPFPTSEDFTPKEGSPYEAPVYIPEDIPIPPDFELRESSIPGAGLGVWAKRRMEPGERFGPYMVAPRATLKEADFGWEQMLTDADAPSEEGRVPKVSEELGSEKFCVDANQAGAGSWLKYIRVACSCDDQNLTMCQISEQIYYKVIKDIEPGEELLVHVKEGAYSLGTVPPGLDEEPTFRCELCDELFQSKLDLRRHKKYACGPVGAALLEGLGSGGSGQAHECKDCERMFPSKSSLEQHMVVHTEEREYKCDQCPKAFNWKSNLIRHQMSHDSGKRFECENCVKVFTDPSNLQRHIRSQHVGARAHACPDCGKTFATSSGLKQHKHIHSTVKPFICEVCHKSYTQFSNLCRHKRMHADCRTQIKCKDCGQMFSTTSSLNKHRRFCEGKNHYTPSSIFSPGLPLPAGPAMDKAKPPPSLNHAGLGFNEYFPSRPHPGGLPFCAAPPALPTLTPGFPGIFPPSLYPRPPLLPPTPLLKSPLNHAQDAKLPSPLGNPALPLVSAVASSGQGATAAAGAEDKFDSRLEDAYAEKLKARGSDLSDGSDFEDINTTTGTDLDTTTGSGSDLDSDVDSDRDKAKDKSKAAEGKPEFGGGPAAPGAPGGVGEVPVFYAHHSFFPPPDEQLLTAAGAAGDSIKAIASIAERYFGPGFAGVPEKKLGALPYHAAFPFQFLPSFPHSLYPFTDRGLAHSLLVKAEPRSPRDTLKVGGPSAESPCDLTTKPKEAKPTLPVPKAAPAPASGEEQPLDLSIGSRTRSVLLSSRVEKRKVPGPVGVLKERYLRPSPLLYHPQVRRAGPGRARRAGTASPPATCPELSPHGPPVTVRPGGQANREAGSQQHPVSLRGHQGPRPAGGSPNLGSGCSKGMSFSGAAGRVKKEPREAWGGAALGRGEVPGAGPGAPLRRVPSRCKYCDRSFSISSNLQRHVRNIHNKEKPFKCHLCNRCFGQQTNLDRHLKKHEHEHAPVSQHSGVLTNHLGTSASSPTSESDTHALLDEKEDSYFSEIRNFIANSEMNQVSARTDKRPEAQDLDGTPQGPGLAGGKPEDAEEEEEDLEEDEDSLAGKSQDDVDAVSPTPEPRGAYEDEEDEEPPASLAVGFDHTRRCIEERPDGLLALEPMPTFGKGLDLRRAAEEAFEAKDVLSTALDSEALKQTLYRQAKNQAYAVMLALSEDAPSQSPLDAWLNVTGATPESGAFDPVNHL